VAPRNSDALRAVIDSNAIDSFIDPSTRYEALDAASADGRLVLMWTHINVDELSAIPDDERRAKLLNVAASLCQFVPTGAAVWDYSRWNFARWTDDSEALDAFRRGNLRHTRDAILAATAQHEHADLVTSDKQLAARATARGVRVWTPEQLAIEVSPPHRRS
jgi:predicted nucleic acid-binding protein